MANINDFKLVSIKGAKYFTFLSNELEFDDSKFSQIDKQRFGFYLFMLENITGNRETLELVDLITDTDFNRKVFEIKDDDYGVDAIVIDEENNSIKLFNFKYREKFKPNNSQKLNASILSVKFVNALVNENINNLQGKLKSFANQILDKLINSNDIWKLQLYIISNDDQELNNSDPHLLQLESLYGLEIISMGLNKISKLMSIRPEPIDCELVVDKDAIMSFTESSISSSKSYVLRLSLSELLRITCDDKQLRNKYNIEDFSPVSQVKIDFGVLFDNVRGLVVKSKYNPNILKTLKDDPTKFFLYNNGVTITADDVEAKSINADKKIKLNVKNFQVLNGGQTLRTVHAYNLEDENHINNNLSKGEILVRVFKTPSDSELTNKIAEYTNSQNAISLIDLKSLSSEQIQLEQYLDEYGIVYARKTGDTGLSEKSYQYKISMERFGQILFTLQGNPHRATNQKKHIFDKYYDQVFGSGNLDINQSPQQIIRYFELKKEYEKLKGTYKVSDQKVFFILYIDSKTVFSPPEDIEKFEACLRSFDPDPENELSDTRKLLSLKFKELVDEEFGIES
jgi:hypothetical protein